MEKIENISMVLMKPNVEVIKADREAYIAEYVEATKDQAYNCSLNWSRDYKCGACNAEFETLPSDAKYCPACLSSEVEILPPTRMPIGKLITLKIITQNRDLIKESWLRGRNKGVIAAKLGISISDVSEVLGKKQRTLSIEEIDYIRNAHLSGRPNKEIKKVLGISEAEVRKVACKLHKEIMNAFKRGIRPEDIGKRIGIYGHDQVIIDIVSGAPNIEPLEREIGATCRKNIV